MYPTTTANILLCNFCYYSILVALDPCASYGMYCYGYVVRNLHILEHIYLKYMLCVSGREIVPLTETGDATCHFQPN